MLSRTLRRIVVLACFLSAACLFAGCTPFPPVALVEVIRGQTVAVGEEKNLAVRFVDVRGESSAVDPRRIVWSVTSGNAFLRFTDGKAVGVRHGEAMVTAIVNGVASAPVKVLVTPVPRVVFIPVLPGADPNDPRNCANAMSADGKVVVGWSNSTRWMEAFRWTEAGGSSGLGVLPGHANSSAEAVNADGSVVVGSSSEDQTLPGFTSTAFIWTEPNGMTAIEGFPDRTIRAEATGVSGDGRRVVGWYRIAGPEDDPNVDPNVDDYGTYGFVWEPNTGLQTIGDFISRLASSNHFNAFTGISADGNVLIATTGYMPVPNEDPNITEPEIACVATRWIQVGPYWEPTMLGWTPDNETQDPPWLHRTSEATSVNADGSIIWGTTMIPGILLPEPFRWTPSTGMDTPIWAQILTVHAQSHDGQVAAGGAADAGTGFIWDAKRGERSLYGVMDELGILDQMWPYTVVFVSGMSADGQAMAGLCGGNGDYMRSPTTPLVWPLAAPGEEQGYFRAFYLEIPRENDEDTAG